MAFLFLAVSVSAACGWFIISTFQKAEEDRVRESLIRGRLALQRLEERLSATAKDWSHWNDTYLFLLGQNPAFPENNLDADAITTLDVDMLALADNDGKLTASAKSTDSVLDPADLSRLFIDPSLQRLDEKAKIRGGLLRSRSRLVAFVAGPVLTSKGTGPKAGLLVLAKRVDEALLTEFSENIGSRISISADPGAPVESVESSGRTITAGRPLYDYTGAPLGRLNVSDERYFYLSGVTAMKAALAAILSAFAISLVAIWLELDRNVLKRLAQLSGSLPDLVSPSFTYEAKPIATADEITILGHRIKQLASEKNRLIADLTAADEEVRTLSELLPVCAWCKQVRDDGGYWHMVDSYLKNHMKLEVTHGICPTCMDKMMAGDLEMVKESSKEHGESAREDALIGNASGRSITDGRRRERRPRTGANSYELLRRFPRLEAHYLVELREMGAEHIKSIGTTRTIGGGGFQIVLDCDISEDSILDTTFEIEGKIINAKARVVWKKRVGESCEMGIEFVHIDSCDHKFLSYFIARELEESHEDYIGGPNPRAV